MENLCHGMPARTLLKIGLKTLPIPKKITGANPKK
jgi:hypothetical protein